MPAASASNICAFRCWIRAVKPSDIHGFLIPPKLEPRTVNNCRMSISNLFAFARLKNYVPKDCFPMGEVADFRNGS
jgi:hypothetical protein